ncbi:MAG: hypothetical protein ACYDFR_03200 [Candidatus Omnitrophota bacterium]
MTRRFISSDDIQWREFNRKISSYSRKGDWQCVLQTYYEMIAVCKEEGEDYSHILKSIDGIKTRIESERNGKDLGCLITIIIFLFFAYFLVFKPIFWLMHTLSPLPR